MDDLYAGVDIGGTSAKIGLVDSCGRVVARRLVPRDGSLAARDLADRYCEAVAELVDGLPGEADNKGQGGRSGRPVRPDVPGSRPLSGIGISICGYVTDDGRPELTNVPVLDDYPLTDHFARRFGVPVAIDNDANAAALAEQAYGAGRGARRMILVAVGWGIGVGVVIDGRLVRFTGGTTGNIGHAIVDLASEERCGLGCRGCLETKVTAPALERRAAASGLVSRYGKPTLADISCAASAGAPKALAILREAGRWLGAGLATFAATFSPEVIVVGGGLSRIPLIVETAASTFVEVGLPYATRPARVVPAALGNDAGMIGAARAAAAMVHRK